MISFLVVFEHPCPAELPDFVEFPEQPGVKHLLAIRPVEAFDVGVLVRFAGLNVVDQDAVLPAPVDESRAEELGPVVGAQYVRQAALGFQLVENPNEAPAGQ